MITKMSRGFKISLIGILGAIIGLIAGVSTAVSQPNYYTVHLGALLGLFQGLFVGALIGTVIVFWNPKVKDYWTALIQSKFRRWRVISVACFIMPFLFFWPYHWYVFAFARDRIVTPRIGLMHQNVHLGVWFGLTFIIFSLISMLLSAVSFVIALRAGKAKQELTKSQHKKLKETEGTVP